MRAPRGTREAVSSKSHLVTKVIFAVLAVGGLMWYTGETSPIAAVREGIQIILGFLPSQVSGIVRQLIGTVEQLFQRLINLIW